jgi:hypothetical protein
MDNIVDGYDMHQLDNTTYIRTLLTRGYRIGVPKQVVFGEDYKVVVGGSDHGAIYVFDRRTGEKLQTLKHAEGGLVQTVTVGGAPERSQRYLHFNRLRNLTMLARLSGLPPVPAAKLSFHYGLTK